MFEERRRAGRYCRDPHSVHSRPHSNPFWKRVCTVLGLRGRRGMLLARIVVAAGAITLQGTTSRVTSSRNLAVC